MKNNNKEKKLSLSKIFISITIVIVITIILITIPYQLYMESKIIDILDTSIQNNLKQISYSAGYMHTTALVHSKQLYFNNDISKLLHFSLPAIEFDDINRGSTFLNEFLAITPYIDSVFLYNGIEHKYITDKTSTLLSIENSTDPYIKGLAKNNFENIDFTPFTRRNISIDSNNQNGIDDYIFTYIYIPTNENISNSKSAVIINISEDWIREIINGIKLDNDSDIIIIDKDGNIVSSTNREDILTNISDKSYLEKIIKSQIFSDSFTQELDNEKYLISYNSNIETQWKFIQITPYSKIFSTITAIRNIIILILIIILLIGLAISRFISGKLFNPYRRINKNLEKLTKEKRENLYISKQEFIKTLILNNSTLDDSIIDRNFRYYNININKTGYFKIIILKMHHLKTFEKNHNQKDIELYNFAVLNIAEEIFLKIGRTTSTYIDNNFVLLIENNSEEAFQNDAINSEYKKLIDCLNTHYSISLSGCVSNTINSIRNYKIEYEKAIKLLNYLKYSKNALLVFPDTHKKIDAALYNYPSKDEENLIKYLRLGDYKKATVLYNSIIDSTNEYTYEAYNIAYTHLALGLNSIALSLGNNNANFTYNILEVLNEINNIENTEDIKQYFLNIIGTMIDSLKNDINDKHTKLIDTINTYIDDNYFNPNISLDSISTYVNLSSVYVGQLYKKLFGKTITKVITDKRIQNSMDFLLETKLSISDIVEKTGFYSKTYFYQIFKKYNGTTPKEFRIINKQSKIE